MTYKSVYFKIRVEVLNLKGKKEHLTKSGLLKIISIKSLFKKGLNLDLLCSFPDVKHADCRVNSPAYLPSLHVLSAYHVSRE